MPRSTTSGSSSRCCAWADPKKRLPDPNTTGATSMHTSSTRPAAITWPPTPSRTELPCPWILLCLGCPQTRVSRAVRPRSSAEVLWIPNRSPGQCWAMLCSDLTETAPGNAGPNGGCLCRKSLVLQQRAGPADGLRPRASFCSQPRWPAAPPKHCPRQPRCLPRRRQPRRRQRLRRRRRRHLAPRRNRP